MAKDDRKLLYNPNQIAKIAAGVSLTGFIDAEGATNAKRNPGEDYSTTHGEAAVRRAPETHQQRYTYFLQQY